MNQNKSFQTGAWPILHRIPISGALMMMDILAIKNQQAKILSFGHKISSMQMFECSHVGKLS
jgi:hypothetical protein